MRAKGAWMPWALCALVPILVAGAIAVGASAQQPATSTPNSKAVDAPGTCYRIQGVDYLEIATDLTQTRVDCSTEHDLQMISVLSEPPELIGSQADEIAWLNEACSDKTIWKSVTTSALPEQPLRFTWVRLPDPHNKTAAADVRRYYCLLSLPPTDKYGDFTQAYGQSWVGGGGELVSPSTLARYARCIGDSGLEIACSATGASMIDAGETEPSATGSFPPRETWLEQVGDGCLAATAELAKSDDDNLPVPGLPTRLRWTQAASGSHHVEVDCWLPIADWNGK